MHPLGGQYVPGSGSLLSNRKFEFMHLQRQKQRLQQMKANNGNNSQKINENEFEDILKVANQILKGRNSLDLMEIER